MSQPPGFYPWLRPLLFRLDPEQAHTLTVNLLKTASRYRLSRKILKIIYQPGANNPVEIAGLRFPNQVGCAAGYDKDADCWLGLGLLGFGHVEIGTVTPRPQPGNPKPRIFRLPEDRAVINRMGFPGSGMDHVLGNLPDRSERSKRSDVILGVNLGKNKTTPNEESVRDYLQLLEAFSPKVDYFTINVSSPNTIGLRELQAKRVLENLVSDLVQARNRLPGSQTSLPIFVKLSPDLSDQELSQALEAVIQGGADGVIATNTTIKRRELKNPQGEETGGLSGRPLRTRSLEVVRFISQETAGKLPIIGVGGIETADDARRMIDSGADLIQIYTGLIYQGPGMVKKMVESLSS